MRVLHHMPVIFFYVNFILNTQKQLGKHQRLLTFDEKRRHNVVTAFEYQAMMPKVVRRSKFPLYVRCVCVCVCDWPAPRSFTFAPAQDRSRDNDCIPDGSGSNVARDTSYQT